MLPTSPSDQKVANWLLTGVGMLIIQIALGGITRLTGSGLSITEWEIVTGSLPPLNQEAWQEAFEKYRQTPQFRLLNFDFQLSDFQFIYFWEWFHRLWARLMGMVFAIGFIYFLIKKYFRKEMVRPLIILFLLGALQGAVGWIMVASGLTGDAVYVKPTRLGLHFIMAMGLLCYTFWFALQLKVPSRHIHPQAKAFRLTVMLIVLLVIQLLLGALMAGHKAATAAATWPLIQGEWLPEKAFTESPFWMDLLENKLSIHFLHRNLAMLLVILTIFWFFGVEKITRGTLFHATRIIPVALVLVQAMMGVASVLMAQQIIPNRWGNFEWMAQFHQLGGMLLLLSLVWYLYLTSPPSQSPSRS
ncbi:MAG: COX15/CtaA family protein [Bacteroidetes bacterium]|nr:COX15/CtaA family protein [Bacteroidota bacterium]